MLKNKETIEFWIVIFAAFQDHKEQNKKNQRKTTHCGSQVYMKFS